MARPRQFSDEDILATARECFLTHGPGVSTTHIARELGMSQAALFKRFGTKDELLIRALLPADPVAWIDMLEGGPDTERPIPDQLLAVATAALRNFDAVIPCFATLKAGGHEPRDLMARFEMPPPLRAQMALARWFGQARELGLLRTRDEHSTAMVFLASLHSRAFLKHIIGAALGPDDVYIQGVVDTLWNGLSPREAT